MVNSGWYPWVHFQTSQTFSQTSPRPLQALRKLLSRTRFSISTWRIIPLSKWSGWWFQSFFIFHNIRDNPSHWLIFFKMVKTTNQWLVAGTITQLCVPPSWSTKISLSTVFVQAWQVSPACNSGSDYERICVPGLEDLGEHGRTESAVSRIPHHLGMG